jgi:sterol desaturase/sphingolipid hydroxylase (fatty acid hydroxylase superfamily)
MTLFVPYMFFSKEIIDIPIEINGQKILVTDLSTKFLLLVAVIAYFLFAYGIFLFRKVLISFQKRAIFSDEVIVLLDKVGKSFLLSSILTACILLVYNFTRTSNVSVEFGGGFSSFLFTASLGLFFMVLSEVFKISKTMKDESDLTV